MRNQLVSVLRAVRSFDYSRFEMKARVCLACPCSNATPTNHLSPFIGSLCNDRLVIPDISAAGHSEEAANPSAPLGPQPIRVLGSINPNRVHRRPPSPMGSGGHLATGLPSHLTTILTTTPRALPRHPWTPRR